MLGQMSESATTRSVRPDAQLVGASLPEAFASPKSSNFDRAGGGDHGVGGIQIAIDDDFFLGGGRILSATSRPVGAGTPHASFYYSSGLPEPERASIKLRTRLSSAVIRLA